MRTRSTIQDLIRQFKSQTGLDEETARRYLESQQWNLKSAIYSYYQEQMVQEPNSSDDIDAISRNTRITIPPRARLESLESLYGSSRGVLSSMMLQARLENKWVLINLQDLSLQSHNFDNDVWSVIKVSDISNFNFIFRKLLQNSSHEFHDIVVNYKVDKFPAILLIDSVTGELLDNLRHLKSAQSVLEDCT
uniref:UBX domain-containing protein 7 (Trinotate prediction) n=1 Tax=Myxobolus squamalis TaxID=59785 RepID=A0A6B2G869_MYXSQ